MGPAVIENLVPFAFFALMFGIVYIRSRENMALIERGINPRTADPRPSHFQSLKWGLLLTFAGLGLLIAFLMGPGAEPTIYFALVGVGGGIGLVLSYFVEKRHWDKVGHKE